MREMRTVGGGGMYFCKLLMMNGLCFYFEGAIGAIEGFFDGDKG
jgi:hypothetical protein